MATGCSLLWLFSQRSTQYLVSLPCICLLVPLPFSKNSKILLPHFGAHSHNISHILLAALFLYPDPQCPSPDLHTHPNPFLSVILAADKIFSKIQIFLHPSVPPFRASPSTWHLAYPTREPLSLKVPAAESFGFVFFSLHQVSISSCVGSQLRQRRLAQELKLRLDSWQLMLLHLAEQWYHCCFDSWHSSLRAAVLKGKPSSELLSQFF